MIGFLFDLSMFGKKDYKNNDAHILTLKLLNDAFIVKLTCFVHVPWTKIDHLIRLGRYLEIQ